MRGSVVPPVNDCQLEVLAVCRPWLAEVDWVEQSLRLVATEDKFEVVDGVCLRFHSLSLDCTMEVCCSGCSEG